MRKFRSHHALGGAAVVVLAAGLLAGCSKHATPDQPAQPRAVTAWQSVLNQVQPDGTVSTATALSAFALAIGPVPGATVPTGPDELIPSGTIAVSWVFQHWADLTDAQRSAVLTALGGGAPPTATNKPAGYIVGAGSAAAPDPNVTCQTADTPGAEKYRAWLPEIVAAIQGNLKRKLGINIFISINTKDVLKSAVMYSVRCRKPGTDTTTGCTIHVEASSAAPGAVPDADLRSILLHETMHCFFKEKLPRYEYTPAWFQEGAPTWVMTDIGGAGFDSLSRAWTTYLDSATKPLAQRVYDGLGFFTHLAETGTDPWTVFDGMGAAMPSLDSTPAGFAAARVTPSFLDSWGSGFLQGRYPGKAWTSSGPNLPPYAPTLGKGGQLPDGATLNLTSPAFAATSDELDIKGSVIMINPGAGTAGRISRGGGTDSTLDEGGPFCTLAQCACPDGSAGAGTKFTPMAAGPAYIGLTGGAKAGSVSLVARSLPDFCAKPPTTCIVGQWTGVRFDVAYNDITETGGAGVKMRIDPKGNLTVVFDGMKPVTFTQSGSPGVRGTYVYNGTISGQIKLPPGGATSGNWDYASGANVKGLTATVHVTAPVQVDLGPLDLVQLAGEFGDGAISSQPLVTGGWTCSGNTMTTTPPANSPVTGTWTLTRTGPG